MKWLPLLLFATLGAWEIDLRGELLYWKPTTGGLYLGQIGNESIVLRPHNELGYSLDGRVWCRSVYGGVQYTHIDGSDRRKVIKGVVPPFGNQEARVVSASELIDLDTLEVRVGYCLYDQFQLKATVYGEVEAMRTRARADLSYGEAGLVREKARYSGIGPGVGIEGDFCYKRGFGLVGRIGTSLLIGQRRLAASMGLYPSQTVVVPSFNGRLAISYRCRWVMAELGYEVRHYVDAFVRGICHKGEFIPELRDLTYGGAFFALTVTF